MHLFSSKTSIGYLLLIGSSMLASFFVICYRQLSLAGSATDTVFLLYSFSLLYTIPWFIAERSWKTKISLQNIFWILMVSISSLAGNFFISFSLKYIAPSVSQMMQRSDILFGMAYGYLLFKDKINITILLGLILSLLGISLIYNEFFIAKIPIVAMSSSIIAAFCFATMQVCTKFAVKSITPNTVNFYRLLCGFLVLLIMVQSSSQSPADYSWTQIIFGAAAALFGPFASRVLINYATIYAPFSAINMILPLSPVLTLFLQFIILDIVISPLELLGSALILTSVFIITNLYKPTAKYEKSLK